MLAYLNKAKDFILPIGIVTSLFVILVPLPSMVMDLMLSANITVAVVVLLTTIYVKTPLEFNIFPSLLLATTLGRLVLNVASTRLILTKAPDNGMEAAGGVIQTFGEFVAGDQIIVGLIIFVIIVVIQFMVITKGATRISEVAARFALDGMPGKQMAIDADLNAGIIDEKQAQQRREAITQEADFYGAMDGASKFVRGDAIAGIIITCINVVGGLVIGSIAGMGIEESATVFTQLTIGDGLVSQIPAFLISLAAALLTTRSAKSANMPSEFLGQLFSQPSALFVAAGFVGLLSLTNLPPIPLLSLGGGCVGLALMVSKKTKEEEKVAAAEEALEAQEAQKPPEERIEDFLTVDPMEMEIGVGLVRLADPNRGGDLLPRITGVRKEIAGRIGVILPKVRIRDNMKLGENEYQIKISNNPVATGIVYPGMMLAMDSGSVTGDLPGEATQDPAFGQPAVWIEPGLRERAEMLSYTPVEPTAVLATHLHEVSKRHADELLTRDATQHLLDELKETTPAVVEELVPGIMKLSEVQQALQELLREEVSIRQLGTILEAMGDFAPRTKENPALLTELVRTRLARTICTQYRDSENRMRVVMIDPAMEDRLASGIANREQGGMFIHMHQQAIEKTCQAIREGIEKLVRAGYPPVVLVNPQIRLGLKKLTMGSLPNLIVLSHNEITRDTVIESVAVINEVNE